MRSIWTRFRESEEDERPDPVSNEESGGGEGPVAQVAQPAPAPEANPVDALKTEPVCPEVKSESLETKPVETPLETKPAETAPVPAQTEVKVSDADSKEGPAVESNAVVDSKAEEMKADVIPEVKQDGNSNGEPGNSGDWQQKELALRKKVEELEEVKTERSRDALKMDLKVRDEEIDLLKARVRNLETELQAALSKPGSKNHEMIENIKVQHEELLRKARGMIFDKTKMVKNQELQIEALSSQVQSLKDINLITKDLLEIRNSEIKAMEDRLQAMEARFKGEKERFGLVLQRAQASSGINDELKKEYDTQLKIFKELRLKYEQKVEALTAENNKLKLDLARGSGSS